MRTKKKRKKSPKSTQPSLFSKYLTREKTRIILGVLFLVFSVYLFIAFVSFAFDGYADQSILESSAQELVSQSSVKANNWAGKGGAWLARTLINEGFGVLSFVFVYLFFIIGLKLMRYKPRFFLKSFVFSCFILVWGSISAGYFFTDTYNDAYFYLGGAYGFFISDWLVSVLGRLGTFMLIVVSLLIFTIVAFENSLALMRKLKRREKITGENGALVDEDTGITGISTIETVVNSKVTDEESPGDDDLIESFFEREEGVDEPLETDIMRDEEKSNGPELSVEKTVEEEESEQITELEDYDPTLDLSNYKMPPLDLLEKHGEDSADVSNEELISNKNRIVETLRNYKIEIVKIKATIGPTVTLYEIVPAPGIRIAKIKNLEDDIALSLSALGIRIIAPIPGKGTIGIEVPNRHPEIVSMRSILGSKKFQESGYELPMALGKTISNETYIVDLAKMPHVLIAGATGQGKSVGLNAIITSLMYKKHPSQLKFVFIDPKKVELNLYSSIENHFLAKMPDEEDPIINDVHKVKATLNSLNIEMDQRYDLLKKAHARNVKEYNKKFITRKLNPEKGHRYLPYIVVVIDEFADLIMTAGKDIEMPIARIAQLARAVGLHMIIATQRPSTNIITGVIKANFPSRIAFKVPSMIDSRTILDQPGANQLIGKGDMLITSGSSLVRIQCAFVDTPEVERICEYISQQQAYPTAFLLPEYDDESGGEGGTVDLDKRDGLFEEAARLVVMNQSGSTSLIQRKFSIGYNRAGRIMDQLEAAGVVGPSEGSKARQILIYDEYALEQLLNAL